MRAHARAHAHSHTSQTHAHSVGMCLGFYRPQKDLSWAENQKFKVALIFGTFASLFHGVQYCTFGLESPRPLRGRGLYKQTDFQMSDVISNERALRQQGRKTIEKKNLYGGFSYI